MDVETIGAAPGLDKINRFASLFPDERGVGYDPERAPFAFHQDHARDLLAGPGYGGGFEAKLQCTGEAATV